MAPLYDHQTARAYENAPGKERWSWYVEMMGIRGNRPSARQRWWLRRQPESLASSI